jgi:hypothetical protein
MTEQKLKWIISKEILNELKDIKKHSLQKMRLQDFADLTAERILKNEFIASVLKKENKADKKLKKALNILKKMGKIDYK